jgi:hypothetical protein
MKKLLLFAILGLAALIQVPGTTRAGTFGLFTHGCCGGCGCGVCIRPYNAFSPVFCGTVCSDCCCPSWPQPGHGGCGPGGCDGAPGPMISMMPGPMMSGPMMPSLMPYPTPGKPPEPLPAPLTAPTNNQLPTAMPKGPVTAGMYPGMMPYGMVQPVGYYPMYYPGYNYGYGYGYGYSQMTPYGYYNPPLQQPAQ